MAKQKAQYRIKSCPSEDISLLENLLNTMSSDGWDLYTMNETEGDEGFVFNCIFVRDSEDAQDIEEDFDETFGYKSTMQKIISSQNEPYERCIDIQRKIKEKRNKINKIKSLIDETSEDQRQNLNDEMYTTIEELKNLRKELQQTISPEAVSDKIIAEKLTIKLSEETLELVNPDTDAPLVAETVKIRQKLAEELGYIIPKIKFENDEGLEANEFTIDVRGVTAIRGRVYPECRMFYKEDLNITKLPKEALKDTDVVTGRSVVWLPEEKTKNFWAEGLPPAVVIGRALEHACIKYVFDLFDYNDLNKYLEIVSDNNMFLIENIIPDFVSMAELKYILTSLIRERVSIKDIVFIFEKINDFSDEETKEDILSRIRHALSRQISRSVANDNNIIQGMELSEAHLKYFADKVASQNDIIRIDNTKLKTLVNNIDKVMENSEIYTPVLIVPMHIRNITSIVMSRLMTNIRVIAREEIADEYKVEIIDRV